MFPNRRGISIGRLFGIRLKLDWSLLVIFGLVTVSLGAGVFPAWHPTWSPALAWATAFGAAVLFFASVLAHELAHALVAKAYGIPVRDITLFLFGGVASIEEDPDSPGKEALMAIVGPLMSIALGVGFSLLGAALAAGRVDPSAEPLVALRQMGPIVTLLAWLGPINILVGLFNMLPGFPLDGGRVLRAALWAATADLMKATRWATRVGQLGAWMLIGAGLLMAFGVWLPVFGTGLIPGLWLAFIGWFLNLAASSAYRQLQIRQALEGLPVARVMRRDLPPAVEATTRLDVFVSAYLVPAGTDLYLVTVEGAPYGLAHARGLRTVPHARWAATAIADIASRLDQMPEVAPSDDAYRALRKLTGSDLTELPVVERGELLGILTAQDIVRWLELHLPRRTGRGLTSLEPREAQR
jgi:Zn-dependent protease